MPFGRSCCVPMPTQGAFMAAAAKLNMSAASASTFDKKINGVLEISSTTRVKQF